MGGARLCSCRCSGSGAGGCGSPWRRGCTCGCSTVSVCGSSCRCVGCSFFVSFWCGAAASASVCSFGGFIRGTCGYICRGARCSSFGDTRCCCPFGTSGSSCGGACSYTFNWACCCFRSCARAGATCRSSGGSFGSGTWRGTRGSPRDAFSCGRRRYCDGGFRPDHPGVGGPRGLWLRLGGFGTVWRSGSIEREGMCVRDRGRGAALHGGKGSKGDGVGGGGGVGARRVHPTGVIRKRMGGSVKKAFVKCIFASSSQRAPPGTPTARPPRIQKPPRRPRRGTRRQF